MLKSRECASSGALHPSLSLAVKAAVRGPSGEEGAEEGCARKAAICACPGAPGAALRPVARRGERGAELSAVAGTEPPALNPRPASRSCQEQVPGGGERDGSCGKVRRELAGLRRPRAGHGATSASSSVGRVRSP